MRVDSNVGYNSLKDRKGIYVSFIDDYGLRNFFFI